MAKKVSRTAPVQNVTPGADPYAKSNSYGKNLGKILGCVCLLVFILFEQLWIGTLACALVFAVFFVLQVFFEKSYSWFTTPYFYVTLACLALAYAEYRYGFISDLLKL